LPKKCATLEKSAPNLEKCANLVKNAEYLLKCATLEKMLNVQQIALHLKKYATLGKLR